MGTRGFFGVVVDSTPKLMYNQCDSYPDGLGIKVLNDARELSEDMERFRNLSRAARLVDELSAPTEDDKIQLADYMNLGVSLKSIDDWYCLTRGLQGSLKECINVGIIMDCGDFPKDSLFCEWGYLVDLDTNVFEVYTGFQKEPHTEGRFATDVSDMEYYPVKLVASFPLSDLPTDEYFLKIFDSD